MPRREFNMTFENSQEIASSKEIPLDTDRKIKLLVCIFSVEQKTISHIKLHPEEALEIPNMLRCVKDAVRVVNICLGWAKQVKAGVSNLKNIVMSILK